MSNVLLTDAGVAVSSTARPRILSVGTLPSWPNSAALTLTANNFGQDYLQGGNSSYQLTWRTDEAIPYARMTMPPLTGDRGSGDITIAHSGSRQGDDADNAVSFIWECRVNQEYIDMISYRNATGGQKRSPKMVVMWDRQQSCTGNEIALVNSNNRAFPLGYVNCGAPALQIDYGSNYIDMQPGGESTRWYNQPRPEGPSFPPYNFQADIWMTFLYQIRGLGQPASFIDLYCYAYGGDPHWADRWAHVISFHCQQDFNNPARTPLEIGRTYISPYTPNKDSSIVHDPYWIDLRKGYQFGPYDFRSVMNLGAWAGPNVPDTPQSRSAGGASF